MSRLERYLFKQCLPATLGITLIAFVILLLERLLQIFELATNASNILGEAMWMILTVMPFYLWLALPIGLFFGVLFTVGGLSSAKELTAAEAVGVSQYRIIRPFFMLAVLVAGVSVFVSGFVQPIARYEYRATADKLKQSSIEAVLQTNKFERINERTFWTEEKRQDSSIGAIFVFETYEDENFQQLLTASSGRILRAGPNGKVSLQLISGEAQRVFDDRPIIDTLEFATAAIETDTDVDRFRRRGKDEHEVNLFELFDDARGMPDARLSQHVAETGIHTIIGRAVLVLLLPFIALPLAMGSGRGYQSVGLAIGIGFLGVTHEVLELGRGLAVDQVIAPWLSTWPILALIAMIGGLLFMRSANSLVTAPLAFMSADFSGLMHTLARAAYLFGRLTGSPFRTFSLLGSKWRLRFYLSQMLVFRWLVISICIVFLVGLLDSLVVADEIANSPGRTAWTYIWFRAPTIFDQTAVFSLMLALVTTFVSLIRSNELVALQGFGFSLTAQVRLFLPSILLIGLLSAAFIDRTLPGSVRALNSWGIGQYENDQVSKDNPLWLNEGDRFISIGGISEADTLEAVSLFDRSDGGHIERVTTAEAAVFQANGWKLEGAEYKSTIDAVSEAEFAIWRTDRTPDKVRALAMQPKQLSLTDLIELGSSNGAGERPAKAYQIWLLARLGLPLTFLALLLICVPIMQQVQKRANATLAMLGALGLTFCFIVFDGITKTLGEAGALPTPIASVGASCILGLIGLYFILSKETLGPAK